MYNINSIDQRNDFLQNKHQSKSQNKLNYLTDSSCSEIQKILRQDYFSRLQRASLNNLINYVTEDDPNFKTNKNNNMNIHLEEMQRKPIKYAATGEKLSDIEVFHPERMAQRILGMGDILSVIEKAEEAFDEEEAIKLEQKLRQQGFDLDDYLTQLRQIKKMGSFSSLLKMIPGMNQLKDVKVDDKEFEKIEAIICSMTTKEKRNTKLLNASRRQRIAKGSGTTVQDINKFIKSFEMTQTMVKKMKNKKGGMNKMLKGMNLEDLKGMM